MGEECNIIDFHETLWREIVYWVEPLHLVTGTQSCLPKEVATNSSTPSE